MEPVYFASSKHPFSNWFPADFVWDQENYSSSEQALMYSKARLFGDDEQARAILLEHDPRAQKQLGRRV
jgi:ribA/ribD-fused uncharacterized protein